MSMKVVSNDQWIEATGYEYRQETLKLSSNIGDGVIIDQFWDGDTLVSQVVYRSPLEPQYLLDCALADENKEMEE